MIMENGEQRFGLNVVMNVKTDNRLLFVATNLKFFLKENSFKNGGKLNA